MAKNKGICPNCGAELAQNKDEKLIGYGAIIKQCAGCGKYFHDDSVKEMACTGIDKDDRRLISMGSLSLAAFGLVGTVVFSWIVSILSTNGGRVRINIFIVIAPILFVMGIIGIVRDICTYKKRMMLLDRETVASKARMENKEYAAMAANFAFKSSK